MKSALISSAAVCLIVAANASAVTCADGVRRAECETARGAVEVRKPVAEVPLAEVPVAKVPAKEVVVEPGREVVTKPRVEECSMVEGRRVCR